jgi:hypothetical protein
MFCLVGIICTYRASEDLLSAVRFNLLRRNRIYVYTYTHNTHTHTRSIVNAIGNGLDLSSSLFSHQQRAVSGKNNEKIVFI